MQEKNKITQAFILGAGLGTRLKPLTDTMPKVMVRIAPDKPLLEHSIEWLRDQGITNFVINIHSFPEVIPNYFGNGEKLGVNIVYSDERDQLMETGGALKKAEKLLDDQFIFMYGDEMHFFNFDKLIEEHMKNNAIATVVLKKSDYPQDGEVAEFDPATKKITHWHTRPHGVMELNDDKRMNAGLYVLSKKILDYIPTDRPIKLDGEVMPAVMAAGEAVYAFPTDEPIFDIGKPEKYERAKEYYKSVTKN